jgi:error-prone DNA polymerase
VPEPHRAPVDYTPAVALPALGLAPGARLEDLLAHLQAGAPGRVWLGATMHRRGDDARRLARLQAIAARARAGAGGERCAVCAALRQACRM